VEYCGLNSPLNKIVPSALLGLGHEPSSLQGMIPMAAEISGEAERELGFIIVRVNSEPGAKEVPSWG